MPGRIAALVLAALALTAAPAPAAVPAGNLVVNPGAEADAGATGSGVVVPQGWTPGAGSLSADVYDQANVAPAPPDGGLNFFFGGHDAESTLTQAIDVSAAAPEIDAGQVTLTLSALLGGFSSQEDAMTITVRYLDASGGILGSVAIGPVTAADRNDETVLLPRTASAPVAAQTRSLSVLLDAVRAAGSDNDAAADNLGVSLSAPTVQPTAAPTATPAPTPAPTATPVAAPTPTPTPTFHEDVVVQPSGTVKVRKPGSGTFVTVSAAAEIPLGSTVDTTHGAVVLSSVPKPGAAPQHARFHDGLFKVTQPGGITQLTLNQPLALCGAHAAAAAKKPKSRRLWGDGHGAFRTQGQFSSATVRGTNWLVEDSCAGTLTRVASGVVAVRDDVRHKTLVLRSGKKYLARPRHR